MKASDDLRKEHEAVLFALKILEKMSQVHKTTGSLDIKDAAGMVEFLRVFADKCHHGKEEGFLFPAYESRGVPRENGPIGAMLYEHELGRSYIQGMDKALHQSPANAVVFFGQAQKYIDLLKAHIEKENNVLFPLGDNFLSTEANSTLLEQFEHHEEEVIGKGKHEELHAQLDRWEEKYLE